MSRSARKLIPSFVRFPSCTRFMVAWIYDRDCHISHRAKLTAHGSRRHVTVVNHMTQEATPDTGIRVLIVEHASENGILTDTQGAIPFF